MDNEEYVKFIKIKQKEECFADPDRIKIVAQSDKNFEKVLPYLATQFPNAIYSQEAGFISYKEKRRMISIFATGKIGITYLKDEEEARQTLEKIRKKINWVYKNKDKIDISGIDKRKPLNALQIYRYLPALNCGRCGFPTCMSFAFKLLSVEVTVDKCLPLFEDSKYHKKKEDLLKLLRSAGFLKG